MTMYLCSVAVPVYGWICLGSVCGPSESIVIFGFEGRQYYAQEARRRPLLLIVSLRSKSPVSCGTTGDQKAQEDIFGDSGPTHAHSAVKRDLDPHNTCVLLLSSFRAQKKWSHS